MTAKISAALVKELREVTGAGMMECKKALVESEGNLEKAIDTLRKSGQAKASKKAGRTAADGLVYVLEKDGKAALVEVNSETDFVAREAAFSDFVKIVAQTVLDNAMVDVDALTNVKASGHDKTIEELRLELVAKLGENIQLRRAQLSSEGSFVGSYVHGNNRIAVVVELDSDNNELARDIAMHIAASKPLVIAPEDVPEEVTNKEKEIYSAQAEASGKPAEIIEKMVEGRLKKYINEISLLGQPFVKDPDTTVGAMLNKHRAKVTAFYRYEVGEGIEKEVEDFREAVMSQVQGS